MGKTDCGGNGGGVMISSVQSLSHVRLFVTPWAAARQASLYITSTEFTQTHVHWVGDAIQPSHPLSSPFPTALNLSQLRIFSNESVLHIRWPKYWSVSFSISLSNEYSGLISFRIADWISLQSKGFSRVFSNITVQKHQFFSAQLSLYAQQIFNLIFFWWTGLCSLSVVDLRPNYGGGNDDNYNLLQNVPGRLCHCWPMPPTDTPGHSQASLGQSLVGSLLLSPGSWCARGFVCALQESVSPVPCKFWQLYGGVNGDLLQEGLGHTQVCCTQSSCPSSRALLTCTSAGDTQTLKGRCSSVSVGPPGAHKVWVEPSDHLW